MRKRQYFPVFRALSAFLALALLALALGGCRPKAVKDGALTDIYADMEATGVLPPMLEVDAEMALDFYGFDPADYAQGVLMISQDSLLADEVLLLRATDAAAAARLKAFMQGRLEAKANEAKGYSPEQYAIIQKGQLLAEGLSLALIVSPDVDKLTAVYRQYATK